MVMRVQVRAWWVILLTWCASAGVSPAWGCQYDLVGDVNGDCRVDWQDLTLIARSWLVDCNETPQDPACAPRVEWQVEAPMLAERDQFTGGVIDGKIYVFGGNAQGGSNLKSTEMFDPATGKWTRRAENYDNAGEGVEELTGAVLNGKLYIFGAYGWSEWQGTSGDFNFVEEYDPATNRWRPRAPKPTVVTGAPATVYGDEIYLFGGAFGGIDGILYQVVEAFKPSTNRWRKVTNIPRNVQAFAVATVGDKAYLIGGYLKDKNQVTGAVMSFDYRTGQWDLESCRPMAADRARIFPYSSAAPVSNAKILLVGGLTVSGSSSCTSNKVDVYDPAGNTWRTAEPLDLPINGHLSVIVDGRVYVVGGKLEIAGIEQTVKWCFSAQY
jgi:N-acetylneuraminic acid mutarotase